MVTLFAAGLIGFGAISPSSHSSEKNTGYVIGEQAADFRLKNYDGTYVSLSDYKDARGFIVVFTSNHCPYAEAYEDRLVSLHKKFADKGFPVIAINPNAPEANPGDNAQANMAKAKEKKFPFPYLSDSLQHVFPRFGASRTPHVFVLDADRIVRYSGTVDDNAEIPSRVKKRYVEDAVHKLMVSEDPMPATTKTVGCKIRLVPRDSITGKVKI